MNTTGEIYAPSLRSLFFVSPNLCWRLCWLILLFCSCLDFEVATAYQVGTPTHNVKVQKPTEHLTKPGYRTVFVDVTRLSADLSRPEKITVGMVAGSYDGSNSFVTEGTIPVGQTNVQIELNYSWSSSYGQTLIVSNDGSTSRAERSGRLFYSQGLWNGVPTNSAANDYNFFYITSDPAVRSFTEYQFTKTTRLESAPISKRSNLAAPRDPIPTFEVLSQLLKTDTLSGEMTNGGLNRQGQTSVDLQAVRSYRHLVAGGAQYVPSSPVGLQPIDFVVISVSELQDLATNYPQKTEALRKWVAMGGALIVTDCGVNFAGLASTLPNLTAHQNPSLEAGRIQVWNVLDDLPAPVQILSEFRNRLPEASNQTNYGYSSVEEIGGADWLASVKLFSKTNQVSGRLDNLAASVSESNSPYAFADYGLGRILATSSDLSDYQKSDWGLLLANAYRKQHVSPANNFGRRNSYYGTISGFQVPNVGEPPKVTFLGLISLFAIIVGPLTFVWLNKINRLNLLLFFIPLMSLLSVLALVGYVIAADGFAFRSNRLSVTHLDSTNQLATTQTIQAIYSGSTPRAYSVDLDTVFSTNTQGNKQQIRGFQKSDSMEVTGGRIAVRTKHHVATLKSQSSDRKLIIKSMDKTSPESLSEIDWEGPLSIENGLGQEIRLALVRTPDGFSIVENLDAGSTGALTPNASGSQLNKLFQLVRSNTYTEQFLGRSRYYSYYGNRLTRMELLDGVTRNSFEASGTGLVGQYFSNMNNQAKFNYLQPGEFVCLCEDSQWAKELRPDTEYVFQMHLIVGKCEVK